MSYDDGRLKAAIEESYRKRLIVLCERYYESTEPGYLSGGALERFNDQVAALERARSDLLKLYNGKGANDG